MSSKQQVEHVYWAVAFVDLLGQQDAFLRTDFIPDDDDPARRAELHAAVRENLEVIELLYSASAGFVSADPYTRVLREDSPLLQVPQELHPLASKWKQTEIRHVAWSDGTVAYASLLESEQHFPLTALYQLVASAGFLSLLLLGVGKPVRGGLDVGTAVEHRGQLFGAAVVKAYQLESKAAKHPRILVGETLCHYLATIPEPSSVDISGQARKQKARAIERMLTRDEDGLLMVHYLGPGFRSMFEDDREAADLFHKAHAFVRHSQQQWTSQGNHKLAGRYGCLARYFASHAAQWGAT